MINKAKRPDELRWRYRHELRRSSAATPIPSKKQYSRKIKHRKREFA